MLSNDRPTIQHRACAQCRLISLVAETGCASSSRCHGTNDASPDLHPCAPLLRRPLAPPSPKTLAPLSRSPNLILIGSAALSEQPHKPDASPAATPSKGKPWWSQTGSNRRPHACKARALPTELWPREIVVRVKPALSLEPVVGLGGLEPPTSRLSSARSNQLSYKPSRPRKVLKTPRPKPTLNPRRLRPLLASKRKVPCVQNERETKTAGPANAARLKPLIFPSSELSTKNRQVLRCGNQGFREIERRIPERR